MSSGQELVELSALRGHHRREIERLEGLRHVEVDVVETKHRERVLLPSGLRVRVPELCPHGELQWSPPAAFGGAVAVEETKASVVVRRTLPVVQPVQGTFVRQWGKRGAGEGQFNGPRAVAVRGEEVIVCDDDDHRIQVFGLDGNFLRQWGEQGAGEGQFDGPIAVAVRGEEVIVCDCDNHRIQVLGLDGTFVRQWGERGAGEGQFEFPRAVAVLGEEVIVCDYNNHRIQLFT